MKLARSIVIASIGSGLALALLGLMINAPASWQGGWADYHVPLAILLFFTVIEGGAAALFLLGLKSYKPELQQAYRDIVIGIVLAAAGTLQLPAINGLNLGGTPWVIYGFTGFPFFLAGVFVYSGSRKLAKLVGVTLLLRSFWLALPVIMVIGSIVSVLLPHAPLQGTTMAAFILGNTINIWGAILFAVSAVILFRIMRHIGAHYKHAMVWLFSSEAVNVAMPLSVLTQALITGNSYKPAPLFLFCMLFSYSLSLRAGYAFVRTESYVPGTSSWWTSLFGNEPLNVTLGQNATVVDMITFIASLASNPSDIDVLLDKVRSLTARLDTAHPISADDRTTLLGIYLEIEDYLVTKEPIRTFSKEVLRSRLSPNLRQQLADYEMSNKGKD